MARKFGSGRLAKSKDKPLPMRPHWPTAVGIKAARAAVKTRASQAAPRAVMVKGPGSSEPIPNLYSAASGHIAHDGRCSPGGHGRLFSIAGLGIAPGRLSDHPDPDV